MVERNPRRRAKWRRRYLTALMWLSIRLRFRPLGFWALARWWDMIEWEHEGTPQGMWNDATRTVTKLIDAGYEMESVLAAVKAKDMSLLRHTTLYLHAAPGADIVGLDEP